ncbi:MAG: CDP-diacylglycerol--glycerol-3-phosphate 3-phosphatidyltransferase [candidate division Zixibacteria bacterium]|nr:CDP-diacylglycerol--glycerol-3-phosphate 3-phosphatidyltransferase [candidate division Zixibacteria bacterium]
MNMPNKLTLLRIVLSPIFMIFFLVENPYSRVTGFVIFLIASITDLIDGHYARKYGIITGFGKFMDPLADKILVTTAFITLVSLGYARAWMVVLIVGREFYVTGIRSLAAYRGALIAPSFWARVKTVIQMSSIIFILLVVTLDTILSGSAPTARALLDFNHQIVFDIILGVTTFITLYTGLAYTLRYYSMIKNLLR